MIERPDEIAPKLRKALDMQGPVVIGVPVDYSENRKLMELMHTESVN